MKVILFYFIFSCFLYACSSDNKNTDSSFKDIAEDLKVNALFSEETIDHSHLLVTFSSSSDHLKKYPLFKVAIVDIIIEVSAGTEIYRQSLYGKIIASDLYLDDSIGVDLTNLKQDAYLYHGIFKVPVGKLEKVEVAFSGSRSEIAILGKQVKLIDSLFSIFSHEDNTNPDDLHIQTLPINVETKVPDNIHLEEGNLKVIAINVDMDMTVSPDPVRSVQRGRDYTLFTPTINIKPLKEKDNFVEPFALNFKQFQYINMSMGKGSVMAFGDPQEMIFVTDYSLSSDDSVTLNGRPVDSLVSVDGVHFVDLEGELVIDATGYHYAIKKGALLTPSDDKQAARYEGIITEVYDDGVLLVGQKLPLRIDDYSHLGGRYFNGKVSGYFSNVVPDDNVVLFSPDDDVSSMAVKRIEGWEAKSDLSQLEIQGSVGLPLEGMLNINAMEGGSRNNRITLEETLTCSEFVTVKKYKYNEVYACKTNNTFNKIEFEDTETGDYVLIQTQHGVFDEITSGEETTPVFIREPDIIDHFSTSEGFISELKRKVSSGYRVIRLVADGDLVGNIFTIKNRARVIAFHPQEKIDDDAGFLIIEDEQTGNQEKILKGMAVPVLRGLWRGIKSSFPDVLKTGPRGRVTRFFLKDKLKNAVKSSVDSAVGSTKKVISTNWSKAYLKVSESLNDVRFHQKKNASKTVVKTVEAFSSPTVVKNVSASRVPLGFDVIVDALQQEQKTNKTLENAANSPEQRKINQEFDAQSKKSPIGASPGSMGKFLTGSTGVVLQKANEIPSEKTPKPGKVRPPRPPLPASLAGVPKLRSAILAKAFSSAGSLSKGNKRALAELNPRLNDMDALEFMSTVSKASSLNVIDAFEDFRSAIAHGNYWDGEEYKVTTKQFQLDEFGDPDSDFDNEDQKRQIVKIEEAEGEKLSAFEKQLKEQKTKLKPAQIDDATSLEKIVKQEIDTRKKVKAAAALPAAQGAGRDSLLEQIKSGHKLRHVVASEVIKTKSSSLVEQIFKNAKIPFIAPSPPSLDADFGPSGFDDEKVDDADSKKIKRSIDFSEFDARKQIPTVANKKTAPNVPQVNIPANKINSRRR